MPRSCPITGKVPTRGRRYCWRGIPKKQKGIGLKVTGIKTRAFLPNLKRKRIYLPDERRFVTVRLSTSALRTLDKVGVNKMKSKLIKAKQG